MIDMQVSQDSLMVKQELALLRETEGKSMEELEAMLKERAWDQLIQQETDFLFLKNDTSFNKMTLFQKTQETEDNIEAAGSPERFDRLEPFMSYIGPCLPRKCTL